MFNWLSNLFKTYERPQNTGVIDAPLRSTDYIVGVSSPIQYKERVQDWTPFMWSYVKQWNVKNGVYYDNLGCTGNYLATAIEAQIYLITGKKRKLSRMWINKMSGTNQGALKGVGNYVYAPADWVRKNGWLYEEDYPTPDSWTTDEYYQDIPEPRNSQLLALAKQNAAPFINEKGEYGRYEFLDISDLNTDKHLKQAPLGCTIPGHQTCGYVSPDQFTTYRDSYDNPWDKKYLSSSFKTVMKFIIEPAKIEAKIFGFKGSPELWVAHPMDAMQRLDKVKADDRTWLDGYYLNEKILTLPIKKP